MYVECRLLPELPDERQPEVDEQLAQPYQLFKELRFVQRYQPLPVRRVGQPLSEQLLSEVPADWQLLPYYSYMHIHLF